MTIAEAVLEGTKKLEMAQVPDASYDAGVLMEHLLSMTRTRLLAEQNLNLSAEKKAEYENMIEKRADRIPLQHITHEQEFMGLKLYVDERVLCPRLDTEVLAIEVQKVVDGIYRAGGLLPMPENVIPLRHDIHHDMRVEVLDLCTGSGCVAISLADHGRRRGYNLGVFAVDKSPDALEVAKKNALDNGVEIGFFSGDLFEPIGDRKYHVITANPPYIASKYLPELMPEVRDHEPAMALDGGEDGLFYYRKITAEARSHLYPEGYLMYEIGFDQGEQVRDIMTGEGFKDVKVLKDLAGDDRVVVGRMVPVPGKD